MQGESLKIVSNSSSRCEQLVGRKHSPELLPSLPHSPLPFPTVIPLSAWFSTPLPLLTHLFLISPSFHPQEDSIHRWLNMKMKQTRWWPGPFTDPHQVSPSEQYWAPSPHPGWATALLFLICYSPTISQPKEESAPTEAQGHPSPTGVWEHSQGQGIWHGKSRGKKCPRHFPSPFGAELLFCQRL